MNKLALKIENLVKNFGKHQVLKNINLSVENNEFVGLVGVNGAGKSTLYKTILDFISIESGKIEIYGKSHKETSSRKAISFLPEKFLPPYYLTGHNFLSYMADLSQVELKREDIINIFKVLDLEVSALEKPVRQFSKGMSQKLGLASCFLSQKPLLLFDEPMSGLDPRARAYLKHYLLNLKEQEKTLFFSTHLLADVEDLCDKIVIIHEGKICFYGSPAECCEHYQTEKLEEAYLSCIKSSF